MSFRWGSVGAYLPMSTASEFSRSIVEVASREQVTENKLWYIYTLHKVPPKQEHVMKCTEEKIAEV
jgi:hypothetical protein